MAVNISAAVNGDPQSTGATLAGSSWSVGDVLFVGIYQRKASDPGTAPVPTGAGVASWTSVYDDSGLNGTDTMRLTIYRGEVTTAGAGALFWAATASPTTADVAVVTCRITPTAATIETVEQVNNKVANVTSGSPAITWNATGAEATTYTDPGTVFDYQTSNGPAGFVIIARKGAADSSGNWLDTTGNDSVGVFLYPGFPGAPGVYEDPNVDYFPPLVGAFGANLTVLGSSFLVQEAAEESNPSTLDLRLVRVTIEEPPYVVHTRMLGDD